MTTRRMLIIVAVVGTSLGVLISMARWAQYIIEGVEEDYYLQIAEETTDPALKARFMETARKYAKSRGHELPE